MSSSKFHRAREILVKEGPFALIYKAIRHAYTKSYSRIYKTKLDPRYWYYLIKGNRKIELGKHSVVTHIPDLGTYRETEFVLQNEKEIIEDILSEITEEDVILDIGANIGVHSLFAGCITNSVISIEPHPANNAILSANIFLNNTSSIDIYSCAFSNESTYLPISGPRKSMEIDGSASVSESFEEEEISNKNDILVKCEIGDHFVQNKDVPHPSVIKIDVEGAEKSVIEGLSDVIKDKKTKIVYIEIHKQNGTDDATIISDFRSAGYTIEIIQERNPDIYIKARRT